MQDLINQIVSRTGISEETATAVVNEVIAYVKQHAPAPIAAQIENYLSGDASGTATGGLTGALGGVFGKREDE